MSDKRNSDPKQKPSSLNETFTRKQVKPLWGKTALDIKLLKKIGLDWRPEKAKPPADPVFEHAAGKNEASANAFVSKTDRERMNTLLGALPYLQKRFEQGGRADRFYPYLLIRSVVGDRGNRPLDPRTPPTASPDIWIVAGEPQSNPDLPELMTENTLLEPLWNSRYSIAPRAHGFDRHFPAGQPYTVYAHVWNLGRAPIIGVRVEFIYAWTSFYDEVSAPDRHQSLGFARLDLGPRTSEHCHRLVKCPQPLVPRSTNGTAQTHLLIVKVSCIGDGVTDPWRPLNDRHVAFHFLNVTG
jgi:hypothetical protein